MNLIQKLTTFFLLLLLIGCVTKPKINVIRTQGSFDYKTRSYTNDYHNLRLIIPNYWTVYSGEALYREPLTKQIESLGWEALVIGVMGDQKAFVLASSPWSDSIESLFRKMDLSSPDPPINLTTREIKFEDIHILEREGYCKKSKGFIKERGFVHKQFAYKLYVVSFSPITDRDSEVLENLSFKLEDKQVLSSETKLLKGEKPLTPVASKSISGPGFSIKFPEQWEFGEMKISGREVFYARSFQEDPADPFREHCTAGIENIAKGTNLEKYFQLGLNSVKKQSIVFQENERGQISINNKDAKWVVFSQKMGAVNVKTLMYFLVETRRGATIGCYGSSDQFSKYKTIFEEIAKSFEFKQ